MPRGIIILIELTGNSLRIDGFVRKARRTTCCQATLPGSLAVTGVSQSRLTPHLGSFNKRGRMGVSGV